jgi:putative transposase
MPTISFKYRIHPTKHQTTQLNDQLELCRRVYNSMLANRKRSYERDGASLSYHSQAKQLPIWKAEHPELKRVHSQVLQNVAKRVDLAFQAFFRRVRNGEEPGYPRFKGPGRYDSMTYPQVGGFNVFENHLILSKIDGAIRIKLHRPVEGEIKTCAVRRYGDKWFACLSCEVEAKPLPPSDEAIGIDVGLKSFAALSDGEFIPNPRFHRKEEKALAKAQKMLERWKKSKARKKVKKAVRRIHERIRNKRHNFLHQESRKIVNRFGVIALEDLKVRNMSRRPKPKKDEETEKFLPNGAGRKAGLNKSILDAGWSQFRGYLLYKAESADREVLLANPAFTSQDCSSCGERVSKDLEERTHACPFCGLVMDRDTNAAKNILSKAMGLHGLAVKAA